MVWKINNNCQIFIEKTDSIAGRQKEIIPHVSAYYVDKYTTISEKGVKTGSNRLRGTAAQELLAGYMLYKYLGISSDEQLVRNEHGKPEIAAGYKNENAAFFNLAHSGPYVVLAISDSLAKSSFAVRSVRCSRMCLYSRGMWHTISA